MRANAFCTKCLSSISCYHLVGFVPNQKPFPETESNPAVFIALELQFRVYGHMSRLPDADPAYGLFLYKTTLSEGEEGALT